MRKPSLWAALALPILCLPVLVLFYWSYPGDTVQFVKQSWIFLTPWIIAMACIRRSVRNPLRILVLSFLPLAVWLGYTYLYFPDSFPASVRDFFMMQKYRPLLLFLATQLVAINIMIYNQRTALRQLEPADPS